MTEHQRVVLVPHGALTGVHLGTHGLLDEQAPNRSFLALAGDDVLTAADIFSLDLDGALVVFSACNSGRGTATAGGDVVGLIRATLAAGAGAVIASLWPVGDEAGCLVMTRFYEHLAGDDSGAALALDRAAADVRSMTPADRHSAYAELADRSGGGVSPGLEARRDIGINAVVTDPPDLATWAPFVYVGR